MMEVLTYTAKEKAKFKTFEWQSRQNAQFGMRVFKMLRPICNDCQGPPEHPIDWYTVCPHFEDKKLMYWSLQPKTIKLPQFETDEDGDLVKLDEQVKIKLIMVPNWTEVPADTSHSDGKAPQKCHDSKGFRFPEEVGVAPMCQFSGCGKAWPRVRTILGDYCGELHAKLAVANEEEINLISTNPRLRSQQLREIVI